MTAAMDRKALATAAGTGLVAQLVLALAGRLLDIPGELYLFAGVLIALGAGAIYVRKAPWAALPLMGGAAAAAIAALGGTALPVVWGEVHWIMLLLGPLGSALVGALGAALARAARSRRR
jgi:hypothetical protein